MKAIDLIRWALTMTERGTDAIAADLGVGPLTQPTDRGGNHPLWVLGHLAWIEGGMHETLTGEPNPVGHWEPLFGTGSEPVTDATRYPPFDEALAEYHAVRGRTLAVLNKIGEAGLDETPRTVLPGFEENVKTVGNALMLLALHNMVHYGQFAGARRAAGLGPLL